MGLKRKLFALAMVVLLLPIGAVAWRYFRRPEQKTYWLRDDILVHGNEALREVAFTFDDGPRPEIVRPLLNALGKYGARSTFFVVGSQVQKHPDIVRRMMNEGHEVANHTYSHPRLDGFAEAAIRAELVACDKAVFAATGAHTNLFRPPGMRYDATVIRAAQSLGYTTIHWKVAAQDFSPQSASEVERKILANVRPGSVVLLHSHPDTVAALPNILATLKARGYRFVTISQMLARLPRPVFVKTNAYAATPPVAKIPEPKPVVITKRSIRRVASKARPNAGLPIVKQAGPKRGIDAISDQ